MTSLLGALDAARGPALRAAVRLPRVGAWLADRARRTPALLGLHAAAAAVLATLAPSVLLVAGPIVLGVRHLAEDVRQLALRRAPSAAWRRALLGFCGALLVVRIAAPAPLATPLEAGLTAVVLAAAGAPLAGALLLGAALAAPGPFRVVLAHAHNVVALGLWLRLFRRESRAAWAVAGVAMGFAALLASGALVPVLLGLGAPAALGLHVFAAADTLAPGVPGAAGVGLAMSFAFLQSVHYAVWVTCIPQDDAGPRSFRQSARRWQRDVGRAGLLVLVALGGLVLAGGLIAPLRTQALYLTLAGFHAYLELACWALLRRR